MNQFSRSIALWLVLGLMFLLLFNIFSRQQPREQEVMGWVVKGLLNKQIATEIGTSEATVKVHRSHLMRKMKVRSLLELGRMADKLKLVTERPYALK